MTGLPEGSADVAPAGGTLRERVEDVLRSVYDPEIPVSIYELGLVYDIDITDDGVVRIEMTLTAPSCPVAGVIPGEVEAKLRAIEGVHPDAEVKSIWDPPWDPSRMSEAARLRTRNYVECSAEEDGSILCAAVRSCSRLGKRHWLLKGLSERRDHMIAETTVGGTGETRTNAARPVCAAHPGCP